MRRLWPSLTGLAPLSAGEPGASAPGSHTVPLRGLHSLRLYDLQIIGDRENAGDAIGAQAGEVLVAFVVDNAFESDPAAFDDDANRLLHSELILLQRWISVNRAEQAHTQAVIHRRWRQNLDLIIYLLHALNALHYILGVGFNGRPDDLADQGDFVAVDAVCEIVEDINIRQHEQLMAHFTLNAFFGVRGRFALCVLSEGEGGNGKQTGQEHEFAHRFLSQNKDVDRITPAARKQFTPVVRDS